MSRAAPASLTRTPTARRVPLCVPALGGNAWAYVKECLDTNWVSSVGPFVERFEQAVAAYVGAPHAVATVNGTAALHLALLAAGVRPDDEVLIPSLTFVACANAVRYVGAHPVFIDAEPRYWQMDPERVEDFCARECIWRHGELSHRATGRRVTAMMPVHILGHPCELDPLLALARRFGLAVIEDATESLGARYRDRLIGHHGDVACFSFNGNKLITTGGGGMLVTDREDLARRAKHLSTQAKSDPIEYIHDEIGYNYRLPNILAAMGCAQMEQLSAHIEAKRRIAATYTRALAGHPGLTPMTEAPWAFSTWWLYTVRVDASVFGMDSRALLQALDGRGVQTRPLWNPLHRNPGYAGRGSVDCPVAERLAREALNLPCSVGLSPDDQEYVLTMIAELAQR